MALNTHVIFPLKRKKKQKKTEGIVVVKETLGTSKPQPTQQTEYKTVYKMTK